MCGGTVDRLGTGDSGGKGRKILESWVQQSRWMCVECCPVKKFSTGNEAELWRNYMGASLGKIFFLNFLYGVGGGGKMLTRV
jgi:hypothetical protein